MTRLAASALDAIIASLRDHPAQWTQGEFRLSHAAGVDIWIANGFWFYHLAEPRERRFGAIGKIRFAAAYRAWRRKSPQEPRYDLGADVIAMLAVQP